MKSTKSKIVSEILEKWTKRKKGHFAVYSKEGKKFRVPLCYLDHPIFRVLLEMAEEFGGANGGPLQLPCEEDFMECVFTLLNKNITSDTLISISSCDNISLSSLFIS